MWWLTHRLSIISAGDFVVDGDIDLQFHLSDFPYSPSNIDTTHVSPPIQNSPSSFTSADWNEDINAMFLPPVIFKSEQTQKRKSITSHRLLTSHEIIKQKFELENKKLLKQTKYSTGVNVNAFYL